jgi:hypothetical protein
MGILLIGVDDEGCFLNGFLSSGYYDCLSDHRSGRYLLYPERSLSVMEDGI